MIVRVTGEDEELPGGDGTGLRLPPRSRKLIDVIGERVIDRLEIDDISHLRAAAHDEAVQVECVFGRIVQLDELIVEVVGRRAAAAVVDLVQHEG